jgi:hypothetical protein
MSEQQKCKSGKHPWVPENIYEAPSGNYRCCRLCMKDSARERRARGLEKGFVRAAGLPKERPEYDHPRTEKELRYLRSLIPCMGCGQTPKEDGWIEHWPGCLVPQVPEGEGRGVGRPRTKPVKERVPKPCLECGQPVDTRVRGNAARTCSDACSLEHRRSRKRANERQKASA